MWFGDLVDLEGRLYPSSHHGFWWKPREVKVDRDPEIPTKMCCWRGSRYIVICFIRFSSWLWANPLTSSPAEASWQSIATLLTPSPSSRGLKRVISKLCCAQCYLKISCLRYSTWVCTEAVHLQELKVHRKQVPVVWFVTLQENQSVSHVHTTYLCIWYLYRVYISSLHHVYMHE